MHTLGVSLLQASLLAQAVQRVLSAQPLLASIGTQLLPHFFVPEAQVPMTQALF